MGGNDIRSFVVLHDRLLAAIFCPAFPDGQYAGPLTSSILGESACYVGYIQGVICTGFVFISDSGKLIGFDEYWESVSVAGSFGGYLEAFFGIVDTRIWYDIDKVI